MKIGPNIHQTLDKAIQGASDGLIVTLGIQPRSPATGYGYIQLQKNNSPGLFPVIAFHEKPKLEKAVEFLKAGNYFWNAGIFVFKVSKMIEHFQKHQPKL